MERKLATVRVIDDLQPITGADAIEVATIGGWKVVVKKGEFSISDLCVYFEVDSFLPGADPVYEFLRPKFTTFEGNEGMRLRTIKLRGQISQGLALPVSAFLLRDDRLFVQQLEPGMDVTEALGVVKWEKPISASMSGKVLGNFPSYFPKTDQERVQNLRDELKQNIGRTFEVTQKRDGSSMTVYRYRCNRYQHETTYYGTELDDFVQGVCSRNLDLDLTDRRNLFVQHGLKVLDVMNNLGFHSPFRSVMHGFALQGELVGPGIQGNFENLDEVRFEVYDIFDIVGQRYLTPSERQRAMREDFPTLYHVPIYHNRMLLTEEYATPEALLSLAKEYCGSTSEGLVFKRDDGAFSFKAISDWYLLKHGD